MRDLSGGAVESGEPEFLKGYYIVASCQVIGGVRYERGQASQGLVEAGRWWGERRLGLQLAPDPYRYLP